MFSLLSVGTQACLQESNSLAAPIHEGGFLLFLASLVFLSRLGRRDDGGQYATCAQKKQNASSGNSSEHRRKGMVLLSFSQIKVFNVPLGNTLA